MESSQLIILLATAIAAATPLIFAVIGETISERAGVINLSADGTIMLAGLAGFAVGRATNSVLPGFAAGAIVGAAVALIIAYASITLKQSQIAVGFVLTLLCADLSSFLGGPLILEQGPRVPSFKIPVLQDIPVIGPILFQSDPLVYLSFILIGVTWWYFYRTKRGLVLRSIGEQPSAAFARGVNVIRSRYFYTLLGGALMGIAGAAFTLDMKAGWTNRHTAGYGWIALAIVIFGGWNPMRAAFGAYLFGILQSLASFMQGRIEGVPVQVFNVLPFVLMILVLVIASGGWLDRLFARFPANTRQTLRRTFRAAPPAALGQAFEQD